MGSDDGLPAARGRANGLLRVGRQCARSHNGDIAPRAIERRPGVVARWRQRIVPVLFAAAGLVFEVTIAADLRRPHRNRRRVLTALAGVLLFHGCSGSQTQPTPPPPIPDPPKISCPAPIS